MDLDTVGGIKACRTRHVEVTSVLLGTAENVMHHSELVMQLAHIKTPSGSRGGETSECMMVMHAFPFMTSCFVMS